MKYEKKDLPRLIVEKGMAEIVDAILAGAGMFELNKRLYALRKRLISVGIVEREKGETDED